MRIATLATLMLASAVPAAAASTPPIRVKLSEDTYAPGDRARVKVKTAEDGYLLVLQQDVAGHVRVLFPLDPGDDARISGGREMEIRSRGDREAFTVGAQSGAGTVLAVRFDRPFHPEAFTRGTRWDLAAMVPADTTDASPPEDQLLAIVDRMADGHYDYDVVSYGVQPMRRYRAVPAWYDPWYYPGWGPWPWYGPRAGFGVVVVPRRGLRRR